MPPARTPAERRRASRLEAGGVDDEVEVARLELRRRSSAAPSRSAIARRSGSGSTAVTCAPDARREVDRQQPERPAAEHGDGPRVRRAARARRRSRRAARRARRARGRSRRAAARATSAATRRARRRRPAGASRCSRHDAQWLSSPARQCVALAAADQRIDARSASPSTRSDDLVPEHERRHPRPGMPAVAVQVGAADPGELDVEHDLAVRGLRLGRVLVRDARACRARRAPSSPTHHAAIIGSVPNRRRADTHDVRCSAVGSEAHTRYCSSRPGLDGAVVLGDSPVKPTRLPGGEVGKRARGSRPRRRRAISIRRRGGRVYVWTDGAGSLAHEDAAAASRARVRAARRPRASSSSRIGASSRRRSGSVVRHRFPPRASRRSGTVSAARRTSARAERLIAAAPSRRARRSAAPSRSVCTPLTSTWRMPSASWFGSKVVPRSANAAGSKTVDVGARARRAARRGPERPSRAAGCAGQLVHGRGGRQQPLVADHEAPEPRRPRVGAVEERLGERAVGRERRRVRPGHAAAGGRTPRAAPARRRR